MHRRHLLLSAQVMAIADRGSKGVALVGFERTAIRALVGHAMPDDVLSAVLDTPAEYQPTSGGYFLTLRSGLIEAVAIRRHSEPLVVGASGDTSCGFVVYLGHEELVLDAHFLQKGNDSEQFRQLDVVIREH